MRKTNNFARFARSTCTIDSPHVFRTLHVQFVYKHLSFRLDDFNRSLIDFFVLFSMWPLLVRDELALPYFSCMLLFYAVAYHVFELQKTKMLKQTLVC